MYRDKLKEFLENKRYEQAYAIIVKMIYAFHRIDETAHLTSQKWGLLANDSRKYSQNLFAIKEDIQQIQKMKDPKQADIIHQRLLYFIDSVLFDVEDEMESILSGTENDVKAEEHPGFFHHYSLEEIKRDVDKDNWGPALEKANKHQQHFEKMIKKRFKEAVSSAPEEIRRYDELAKTLVKRIQTWCDRLKPGIGSKRMMRGKKIVSPGSSGRPDYVAIKKYKEEAISKFISDEIQPQLDRILKEIKWLKQALKQM